MLTTFGVYVYFINSKMDVNEVQCLLRNTKKNQIFVYVFLLLLNNFSHINFIAFLPQLCFVLIFLLIFN